LTFEKIWDAFILEETKLETMTTRVNEVQDLVFTRKMRKCGKKGPKGVGSWVIRKNHVLLIMIRI